MSSTIKIVFGGAGFVGKYPASEYVKDAEPYLQALEDGGVQVIDTAQLYKGSEELLGELNAASRFIIDTKHIGGFAVGSSTKEEVLQRAEQSLKTLKTDKVDVFYIHAPDRKVPISETLSAIDELHKAGKFQRFGLSNFKVEQVEEVIQICEEKNYVLPSVYQGNYSPVARLYEKTLFPLLRKYNMSFYAYSPLAGGFLTKTRQQLADKAGRFDPSTLGGKQYTELYLKPSYLDALDEWNAISKDFGISKAELSYRWVAGNSLLKAEHGDAVILGARNVEQLKETIDSIKKGPLSEDVANRIEEVWRTVEADAPLDNYNSTFWASS